MNYLNYDLFKRGVYSFILSGSLAGTLVSLSGCTKEAVNTNTVNPEVIMDITTDGDETIFKPTEHKVGVKTEIDGEDLFDLVITYYTDEKEWRSTSDRALCMDIHTEGLDDKYEVYIDNIHTDTSIVSTLLNYSGINTDSMDDRIHNSVDRGFSISDDNSYRGINIIEGQNDTITEIFSSESSSSVKTYRVSEEDLLKKGVFANNVDSVFGLIIINKETDEVTWVDVRDNIVIPINNIIEYSNGTQRIYSRDGSYTDVSKTKK